MNFFFLVSFVKLRFVLVVSGGVSYFIMVIGSWKWVTGWTMDINRDMVQDISGDLYNISVSLFLNGTIPLQASLVIPMAGPLSRCHSSQAELKAVQVSMKRIKYKIIHADNHTKKSLVAEKSTIPTKGVYDKSQPTKPKSKQRPFHNDQVIDSFSSNK